jgi:SNF2 family DNA or RNA helicase
MAGPQRKRRVVRGGEPAVALPPPLNFRLWPLPGAEQAILAANSAARLQSTELLLTISPVGVVSVPLAAMQIRTIGWQFTDVSSSIIRNENVQAMWSDPGRPGRQPPAGEILRPISRSASRTRRHTRIRPPRDVIKLVDRLRLLLEPPLEALLSGRSLRFARQPFTYQLDGIAFLYPRREAVLADEMGLGKTMQAITTVRLLLHQGQLRRVLLLCPKSLITNWRREFALWAPELPVTVVEGEAGRRRWLWRETGGPVTVANYELLVRDRVDVCHLENPFDLVILDEAQRIKNRTAATNDAVRSLTRSRSWALTGTPMENSVEDLVGIFDFVAPGKIDAAMKPRAISRAAADYVLRRTKEQVLADLPPILYRDAEVELTFEQAGSYRLAEDEGVMRLREMKKAVTIHHVFELVLRLKQICNFDPATGASSKLERLEADLEECVASGRKAIVFSQWVDTLGELRARLARFAPAEYHGQIPQRHRDAQIDRFRDDTRCHLMLMSYGAGSVGLNLQFAGYVFLFDRWWNPAVEDQAIHRAHRIGAKRPVTVTRFLSIGTIEQRIQEILERKRELFAAVFGDGAARPRFGLSREEVLSLFDLDAYDSPLAA